MVSRVKKECENCGFLFTPTSGTAKYCTDICSNVVRISDKTGWSLKDTIFKEYRTLIIMCKYCGSEFVPTSRAEKLCSKSCKLLQRNFLMRKRRQVQRGQLKQRRNQYGQHNCECCGIRFIPKNWVHKYCCMQCRNLAQKERDEIARATGVFNHGYLKLRFQVFQRDGFSCKYCGRSPLTDSSIVLHVDHIHPESKGGEFSIENLITSCFECNLGKSDILLSKRIDIGSVCRTSKIDVL